MAAFAEAEQQPVDAAQEPRTAAVPLCRVSILADRTQVDVALPAEVPTVLMMHSLVDLVTGRAPTSNPADPETTPARWLLSPIGAGHLDPALSLHENGVRDGDLLVLSRAEATPPPPLFDDIIQAVALRAEDQYRQWNSTCARWLGYLVAVCASLAGAAALIRDGMGNGGLSLPASALAVAAVLLGAAAAASRAYCDDAGVALAFCAVPIGAVGGALLVPGELGGPHLLLGLVVAGCAAAVGLWSTQRGAAVLLATLTAATIGAAATIVDVLWAVGHLTSGAAVLAATPLLLALAPRLAILLAKLPLPPVPTPGAALDPYEDDPQPGMENIGAVGAITLSTARSLELRAAQAQRFLTGLLGGITASACVSAFVACGALWSDTAGEAGPGAPALVLVALTALVLMLRGRSFADWLHALILIGGGAVIVLGVISTSTLAGTVPSLALFAVAVGVIVAAFTFGVLAPARQFSPVQRRIVEITEYTATAAIVPVACWALGLYSLLRAL